MAGRSSRTIPGSTPASTRKGKPPAAARKAAKPSVLGRVFARPGVIIAGAAFAAVMTGIIANALVFQKGHHPSPLFGQGVTEPLGGEPARSIAPVPAPLPVPRQVLQNPTPAPAMQEAPAPVLKATAPAAPAPSRAAVKPAAHVAAPQAHATPSHKAAAAPVHRDLIGQLLNKQDPKNP